jgi:hypothetical protein
LLFSGRLASGRVASCRLLGVGELPGSSMHVFGAKDLDRQGIACKYLFCCCSLLWVLPSMSGVADNGELG